jgi:hypothetical protein
MTTTIPSGLGTTLGATKETTYGTPVVVTNWVLIDAGESLGLKKNIAQSKALSGNRAMLSKRRALVTTEAAGAFTLDLADKGMGKFFQGVMGSASTAAEQGTTTAYLQQHYPGLTDVGFSYTFQKGLPETPSGTVQAFTYPGSKIVEIEISCGVNEIAKLAITLDSQSELTATSYAAPTFPTPDVFTFAGVTGALASVLLGGTLAGTAPEVISGSPAAPSGIISKVSVKIANKFDTARFNIGAIVKAEPVENDFYEVTGTIDIEFANLADYYNAMAADTVTPLQIYFGGPLIASTYYNYVKVIVPACRFEAASPKAADTGVVKVSVPFTGLNNGLGDPVVEIDVMSTDATVL